MPIGLPGNVPDELVQLEWCASYAGPARSALHALKYDGERRLAGPLGALLAERWRRAGIGGDLVVNVPVHRGRLRERGFDQAELLARSYARQIGLPFAPALARATETRKQHALGRTARAENVAAAFVVPERLRGVVAGRWIVLIDDLVTTGATMTACGAALREAGSLAVAGLAVARER